MDAGVMVEGGRAFWVGQRVMTPLGSGEIIRLLPGYEVPIAVRLDADDRLYWFSVSEVREEPRR